MNRILRKAALISSFAVPAMLGAQVANAALITEWDYEIDSTFSAFTPTAGNGTVDGTGTNAVLGGDTTLSWGTQDDGTPEPAQSSISVTSDVDGGPPALQTNIGSVPGASFTHVNNEIDADSSFLDTFMLTTQLSLTSTQPLGEAGQNELVGPITFNSNFIETENDGTCVAGSTSNCDDIFVLDNAATLAAIGSGQSFNLGGFTYTVFLDVMGLGPLTDAQLRELVWLVQKLQARFQIPKEAVYVEVGAGVQGPAVHFPHAWFRRQLRD